MRYAHLTETGREIAKMYAKADEAAARGDIAEAARLRELAEDAEEGANSRRNFGTRWTL